MISLEKISSLLQYDLGKFFKEFVDFSSYRKDSIFLYYQGLQKSLNPDILSELDTLFSEAQVLQVKLEAIKSKLSDLEDWEVIDLFTEIVVSLDTCKNVAKWCRSTLSEPQTNEMLVTYTLSETETIEEVSKKLRRDYNDIYLGNHLSEEGSFGGYQTLSLPLSSDITSITGDIIEVVNTKSIYGKDLDRDFAFENEDCRSLDYDFTIKQSFETLLNLKQNGSEEFPDDGIDKTLLAGSNIGSLSYPVVLRQLFSTITSDQAFSEVSVLDIKQDGDSTSLKVRVKTKLNEEQIDSLI